MSKITEIKPVNPKGNQSWIFIGRTDAEVEAPLLWPPNALEKEPWCWERLKARGEGDDRGWDGWMASPTQWTWAWASSGKWWWTGRPGVLQSMRSQRVRRLSGWTDDDEDNGDKKWWSWDLNPGLQTEDPGRLESMQPQRVGHDLVTKQQLYNLGASQVAASGKESACPRRRHRDMDLILGSGRSPGGGHGYSLQYSHLRIPMDRGAWWAIVHRVTKSRIQLKWFRTHTLCDSKFYMLLVSSSWSPFRGSYLFWRLLKFNEKRLSSSKWNESRSVVSDSLWPPGLYSPWNSPGQNTGVGSLSLLQGIFSAQGLNPGLPHCRWTLYQLSYQGSPNGWNKGQRKTV